MTHLLSLNINSSKMMKYFLSVLPHKQRRRFVKKMNSVTTVIHFTTNRPLLTRCVQTEWIFKKISIKVWSVSIHSYFNSILIFFFLLNNRQNSFIGNQFIACNNLSFSFLFSFIWNLLVSLLVLLSYWTKSKCSSFNIVQFWIDSKSCFLSFFASSFFASSFFVSFCLPSFLYFFVCLPFFSLHFLSFFPPCFLYQIFFLSFFISSVLSSFFKFVCSNFIRHFKLRKSDKSDMHGNKGFRYTRPLPASNIKKNKQT